MNANELHANLSALLNGEDPDTGAEVDFDDSLTIEAEASGGEWAGVLSDGSPMRFTVTGFKVVEGRLVLEMNEIEPDEEKGESEE